MLCMCAYAVHACLCCVSCISINSIMHVCLLWWWGFFCYYDMRQHHQLRLSWWLALTTFTSLGYTNHLKNAKSAWRKRGKQQKKWMVYIKSVMHNQLFAFTTFPHSTHVRWLSFIALLHIGHRFCFVVILSPSCLALHNLWPFIQKHH